MIARLAALAAMAGSRHAGVTSQRADCSCGTPGLTYEGPQEDCEVHGEWRSVLVGQRDAARAEAAGLRAEVELLKARTSDA